jgi:ankyrin repeat protein
MTVAGRGSVNRAYSHRNVGDYRKKDPKSILRSYSYAARDSTCNAKEGNSDATSVEGEVVPPRLKSIDHATSATLWVNAKNTDATPALPSRPSAATPFTLTVFEQPIFITAPKSQTAIPASTAEFLQLLHDFSSIVSCNVPLSHFEEALRLHGQNIDVNACLKIHGRPVHPLSYASGFSGGSGNYALVKLLLKYGANPNLNNKCMLEERMEENSGLLCAAIKKENIPIMTLLLKGGANPNLTQNGKVSVVPLQMAEETRKQEIVNLLKRYGAESSETLLFSAARKGDIAEVRRLIEQGVDINHVAKNGTTALYVARQNLNSELIALLERRGARKLSSGEADKLNDQFLTLLGKYSIQQGRQPLRYPEASLENIKKFIDQNRQYYDLDKNELGEHPLSMATDCRSLELTRLLLENGASPNIISQMRSTTPLITAIRYGDMDIIKLLLKYKADPNQPYEQEGESPIMIAAACDRPEIVELLINAGADVHYTADGLTALIQAVYRGNGNIDIVRRLLHHNIDIASRGTIWGDSALFYAKNKGYSEIAALLEKAGATLNEEEIARLKQ